MGDVTEVGGSVDAQKPEWERRDEMKYSFGLKLALLSAIVLCVLFITMGATRWTMNKHYTDNAYEQVTDRGYTGYLWQKAR